MKRSQHSKRRGRRISRADDRLLRAIKRLQSKFSTQVIELINSLDRDGDKIKNTKANIAKISRLNKEYRQLIKSEGKSVADTISEGFDSIIDANESYFTEASGKDSSAAIKKSKDDTYGSVGLSNAGKVVVGGLIHAVLFDESPVNKVKSFLLSVIRGETKVKDVILRFNRVVGRQSKRGILEKHIYDKIPAPFDKLDRSTGTIVSISMKLNYAIYQGGVIRNTRPFCKIRNNKVFTRAEIAAFGTSRDKFGGYTNKSTGDFQGKPDLYDPFVDCGGIRCRHQWDYISEDLAFALRPDLEKN